VAFYIYRSIVFVVSFSSSPFRFLLPLLIPTHPAVAAQLVAVVDALLLGQREALPPLVEVAQARVDLAIVHPTCSREKKGGVSVPSRSGGVSVWYRASAARSLSHSSSLHNPPHATRDDITALEQPRVFTSG